MSYSKMLLFAHVYLTTKYPYVFIIHSGIGSRLRVKYSISNCPFVAETFWGEIVVARIVVAFSNSNKTFTSFLIFYKSSLYLCLKVQPLAELRLCELSVNIPVKQKTQQSIDRESVPTVPLQQIRRHHGQSNKCHIYCSTWSTWTVDFHVFSENGC